MTTDEAKREYSELVAAAAPLHHQLKEYGDRIMKLYAALRWEGLENGPTCGASDESGLEHLYGICHVIDQFEVDMGDSPGMKVLNSISELSAQT